MNKWQKIVLAMIGSGLIGGLTYASSLFPEWGQIATYLNLAISGTMSVLIGWPPKET
jgi:hypothetical protein